MTQFSISLVSDLAVTPVPGLVEALEQGDFFTLYITGGNGERKAPTVLAHTHPISEITGLTTALAGKEASFTKGGFSSGSGIALSGTASSRLVGAGTLDISLDTAWLDTRYILETFKSRIVFGDNSRASVGYSSGASSDITKSGFYYLGGTATDRPANTNAHTIHVQHPTDNNFFLQIASPYSLSQKLYFRKKDTGVLDAAWRALAEESWVNSQLGSYVHISRTLGVTGAAGRVTVTGSGGATTQNLTDNRSWAIDLATVSGVAGAYNWGTVDAYGRVTSASNVSVSSVAWSAITGTPSTLAGYGIQGDSDNRYLKRDGTNSMSGALGVSRFPATTASDYLVLYPTDYGSGNPRLAISSLTTANHWQIGLWDNSSTSGRINFASGELTHNGNYLATQSWVNGQGFVTGGPYVPTSRTLSFTANDGLNVSGTPISDLSGDRIVTFGISGIDTSKITSGTLSVARGGTGLNSFGSPGQVIMTNGSSNYWGTVSSGGVSGSGTSGYIPKFTGGTSIGNSIIREDSGKIGIDVAPFGIYKLAVNGYIYAGGDVDVSGSVLANSGGIYTNYARVGSSGTEGAAAFQVNATNRGSIPFPRMTTSQWNAISSKPEGLFAWNTDEKGFMFWDGTRTSIWRFNGTNYQGWTGSSYTNF